jgi:hypothetical protein
VTGRLEELVRGGNCVGSVVLAGEAGNEERHGLVADELVHDPVPAIDDAGGCPVEACEELPILPGLRMLRRGHGTAHVREQDGDLDLGAARVLVRGLDAERAEAAVEDRGLAAEDADEQASGLAERGVAELAAGTGRDALEDALDTLETVHLSGQSLPPGLLRRLLPRHRREDNYRSSGSQRGRSARAPARTFPALSRTTRLARLSTHVGVRLTTATLPPPASVERGRSATG